MPDGRLRWRAATVVAGVLLLAAGGTKVVFEASEVAGTLVILAILAFVWIFRIGNEISMRREARRRADPRYRQWGSRWR